MGKAMELIESQTVTGVSVLSVSFTSIPQTFEALQLVMTMRTNAGVNYAGLDFTFNGDTTVSNYYRFIWESFYWGSLTNYIYSGNASGNSWMMMPGDTPGGQTAGNAFGELLIPSYSQTTLKKNAKIVNGWETDQGSIANGRMAQRIGSGGWNDTAAINQIDITSPTVTDVFRANTSVFSLYGWADS